MNEKDVEKAIKQTIKAIVDATGKVPDTRSEIIKHEGKRYLTIYSVIEIAEKESDL